MQPDYTQENWHDWAYRAVLIGIFMFAMVWLYNDIKRRETDPCSNIPGAIPAEYYQHCMDKTKGNK